MHNFFYRRTKLFCEGVSIESLARKYGTPLYIYSRKTIEDHFRRLDKALAPLDHLVCYAMKANSNLAILSVLAKLHAGFDIVSAGELRRVIRAGGDPSSCIFAGVGKTEDEIRYALRVGIYCFNVESEAELHRIHRIALDLRKKAPIALRVNPNVEAHTHSKITTGTYENKFGIPYEDIERVYGYASAFPGLYLRGIQMHIGSQITTVTPFIKAVRKMLPLVRMLRDRHSLEFFSIGGGIGIVYHSALDSGNRNWWSFGKNQKTKFTTKRSEKSSMPITIDRYTSALIPLLKSIGMKILLEPGRFIVGNAGVLVTKVEYLKHTGDKNFIIVDAGMNDLIRPAFYDSYHEIVPVCKKRTSNRFKVKTDIVGPVCESGDRFAKGRLLNPIHEGDYLALMSAGAYGFSMASNYNTRSRPSEILVFGKSARIVRRREVFEDLIRGETT